MRCGDQWEFQKHNLTTSIACFLSPVCIVNMMTDVVSIHDASFPVNSSCSDKVMLVRTLDKMHPCVALSLTMDDDLAAP